MLELFNYLILFFSLIAIVLTFGVIWRVEERLDASFKFFLAALIVFTLGVLLDILEGYGILPQWRWEIPVKGLFIIFFTLGIFEMRTLIISLEKKRGKE